MGAKIVLIKGKSMKKNKKSKGLPITIRAARINGLFVVIATVIGVLLAALLGLIPLEKIFGKYFTEDNDINVFKVLDYREDDGTGFSAFKGHLKVNDNIHIEKSGYIDLVGDGNFDEYFIIYKDYSNTDKNLSQSSYIALTSKRFNRFELLFYENNYSFESFDIVFFNRDNKPQIMIYSHSGSGYYLSFSIYEYDNTRLNLLYNSDYYYQGDYHFIGNKFLISHSSRIYSVIYDYEYKVIEYNDSIPIPSDFSATKVMSFSNINNKFEIYLNNNEIKLRQNTVSNSFETIEPIVVNINDIILINTNMQKGERIGLRMLINNEDPVYFIEGLYPRIIFRGDGLYLINLSINYEWYSIYVNVR